MLRNPIFTRGTLSLGDAEGAESQRIARHHHLTLGGQQDDVVGAVEFFGEPGKDAPPVGHRTLMLQLVRDRVHDDLGVGIALQMVVALFQQLLLEVLIVGELPVEGEREPLGLATVRPLERLRVAPVVLAASGITDVPDRGRPGLLLEDRFKLVFLIDAERFGNRAEFLVGIEQRLSIGTETRHPGGQLTAVLDVEEHPRHQPGHAVGVSAVGCQQRHRSTGQMVDCDNAALVVQRIRSVGVGHLGGPRERRERYLGPWQHSAWANASL
jgi:hypothetical protein